MMNIIMNASGAQEIESERSIDGALPSPSAMSCSYLCQVVRGRVSPEKSRQVRHNLSRVAKNAPLSVQFKPGQNVSCKLRGSQVAARSCDGDNSKKESAEYLEFPFTRDMLGRILSSHTRKLDLPTTAEASIGDTFEDV